MNNITYFNTFLSQKNTGIPYSTQWLVGIQNIPNITDNELADCDTQTWSIKTSSATLQNNLNDSSMQVGGNILAQSVTIPGEKVNTERVGVDENHRGGFTSIPIIKSRADNDFLEMSFLETSLSFVDLVIRPWIIQIGYRGFVPRTSNPRDNLRTTVNVIFMDRGDSQKNTQPRIRKQWNFFNCAPIFCDADTVDYQKNQITTLKCKWIYTHYTSGTETTVKAPLTNPLPSFNSIKGMFNNPLSNVSTSLFPGNQ